MTSSGKFDVYLDGVGYQLFEEPDTAFGSRPALEHQSVRAQREQSVAQGNIGEATVNPLGFWRRSIDGWHDGAGQTYYDRAESDPLRFRQSTGIDVFGTKHQLGLLNDTMLGFTGPGASTPTLLAAGSRVYFSDSAGVVFTSAPLTTPWTTTSVTGFTGVAGNHKMATDGATVYLLNNSALFTTTTSSSAASSFITSCSLDGIAYVKGRLMAWFQGALYNITAGGASLPSPIFTSSAPFQDICGGPEYIYALAVQGNKGIIYKTAIKPDGTALDVPTVAGELPDGEVGLSIFAYLGFVFVGLGKGLSGETQGLRMASIDSSGNLIFGSLIPTIADVIGWEAHDRFVWFGMGDGSGADGQVALGRLDLSVFTLPNTPAYAADLRCTQGGPTNGITTSAGKRIFNRGQYVYVETSTPVASGTIDSGLIALDLADPKTPVSIDVEGAYPSSASISEALSEDRGASFTTVATFNSGAQAEVPITGQPAARQFELRTTLTADGASTPTLYRHTLKTEPAISQDVLIQVKLRLYESIVDNGGMTVRQDPEALRVGLEALQKSRQVVTFTRGSTSYQVTVRDLDTEAHSRCAPGRDGAWNTLAVATLKVVG